MTGPLVFQEQTQNEFQTIRHTQHRHSKNRLPRQPSNHHQTPKLPKSPQNQNYRLSGHRYGTTIKMRTIGGIPITNETTWEDPTDGASESTQTESASYSYGTYNYFEDEERS
jgi:hypothetical protein